MGSENKRSSHRCKLIRLSHSIRVCGANWFSYIFMLSAPIDLFRVRQLFSRIGRIENSNFLRREIASRMREKLELVIIQPGLVLDAGCGEAADLSLLQKRFPKAEVLGLDCSMEMLGVAKKNQVSAMSSVRRLLGKWGPESLRLKQEFSLICGDFSTIPCAKNSIDLIWSNLALHWHPQPDKVFAEWSRVLRPESLLMFSYFGPDTFLELRQAFAGIDQFQHTLPFVDMHDFGDMLVNSGFATPVMDMEKLTLTYDSVDKLLVDVRSLGGNPLITHSQGSIGREMYRSFYRTLNAMRNSDGLIPLTIEVVYGHAFKPIPKKISTGESIIKTDFPLKRS